MSYLSDDSNQDYYRKESQNDQCSKHSLLSHMMRLWAIRLIRNGLHLVQILQGMLHLLQRLKAFLRVTPDGFHNDRSEFMGKVMIKVENRGRVLSYMLIHHCEDILAIKGSATSALTSLI